MFGGAAGGATRSTLSFDGARYDFSQQALNAFVGYSTSSGWSARVALGSVLGGRVERPTQAMTYDISPGVVGSIALSRRWTIATRWFATGSASFGASTSSTEDTNDTNGQSERLVATDFRVGVTAGRTFGEIWSPYVLTRAFVGPVSWAVDGENVVGTDVHKYQLGGGLSVATTLGLSAVVDVSLLGEQSASLGASWQF